MMRPFLRLAAATPFLAAAVLALAPPVHAATCGDRLTTTPFAAWGDRA